MCSKVVKFDIKNCLLTSIQFKGNLNCFFCDTLNQMHEQYDIFPILNNINQWDDDKLSQMRHIHQFKCYVCNFDVDNFILWIKHIISNEHMSMYHKVNKLYSYSCGACKILFYGPEDLIRQHRNNIHCDKSKLPCVSILMSELMSHLYTNSKLIYFCAHCKTFSETPLHSFAEHSSNYGPYYCKYCDITFLCSSEVLDCHSLSVEHVTLKCIYLIKEAIDFNCVKKHTQVQNTEITNGFRLKHIPSILPLIILNRFQNISELMPKCKICNIFVSWNTEKIIEHITNVCTKNYKYSIANKQKTSIKTYDCRLCNYTTKSFSDYTIHVISSIHLINFHLNDGFYSYFCNICNLYMYSSKLLIKKHWNKKHNKILIELPLISNVLADNYKYVSNHPECESIEYCDEQLDKYSDSPIFKCYVCKIDFHVSINKYNLHEISSEHIILKYFTQKYTSQVMNNKSLNIKFSDQEYQSSEKNNENGKKLQKVRVINGQIKKGSNREIEAFPNIKSLKKDEQLENSEEKKLCSRILSTNIDCCEYTNECCSAYQNEVNSLTKVTCTEPVYSTIDDTDISLNTCDLDLKEMVCKEHNMIRQDSFPENTTTPLINISTTMIDETLSNNKLYEKPKSIMNKEEHYGKYVTERLRNICDDSIKSEIKHEIEIIFNRMSDHIN